MSANIEDSKLLLQLWWAGILQQMIDIAFDLLQFGAQLVARLFIQIQQDHAELAERHQTEALLIVNGDDLQGGVE